MKKTDIHDIILVGGSTRIPKIQALIKNFFDGKEPKNRINPDEAVAQGAAVQGGMLKEDKSGNAAGITLVDVTPISFGVETVGNKMSIIIPRASTLPTKMTKKYTTTKDYQESVEIKVYEGEHPKTDDNKKLGEFTLKGIQKALKNIP
jgi:molecular chaperone DnaK (HSP70)